jgi:hypothetical protein
MFGPLFGMKERTRLLGFTTGKQAVTVARISAVYLLRIQFEVFIKKNDLLYTSWINITEVIHLVLFFLNFTHSAPR